MRRGSAARREPRDDSRQRVARPRRRETDRAARVAVQSAVGLGHVRLGALERHDGREPLRREPRDVARIALDVVLVDAEQRRHLAGVRREHGARAERVEASTRRARGR
jgi:hypothetical protein